MGWIQLAKDRILGGLLRTRQTIFIFHGWREILWPPEWVTVWAPEQRLSSIELVLFPSKLHVVTGSNRSQFVT
jgi:hypothetical protein